MQNLESVALMVTEIRCLDLTVGPTDKLNRFFADQDCVRTQGATGFKYAYVSHKPVGIENGLYWPTGYGNSHINQTGIVGSWAQGKSHSHKI